MLPGFVSQFGIRGDPNIQSQWRSSSLPDDPIRVSNSRGTVTFATAAGPNTRTTQVFVNTREEGNAFLDNQGFAPFAEVVDGFDILERINSEYGETPNQQKINNKGQEYLDRYPNLTYIRRVWEEKIESAEEAE